MAKWEKVKLGEIFEISSGGTPSRSNLDYWNGGNIPWIKISDMQNKYISKADEYITLQGLNCSSAKLYKKGTFLFSIFATLGAVSILSIDASTNQAIAGLEPKKDICSSYIYYALQYLKKYIQNKGRGVAQNNINLSILRNISIFFPPLEEQKKIAERLDAVSDLLEKQKQLLAEQDNLIKSIFYDMFGDPTTNSKNWKQGKIKDVVEDIQYGLSEKADEIGEFPILRMNNISYSGEMDYSDLKYVNKKPDEKYFLKKGDILFNRTNSKDLVGKTGMYDKDDAMLYAGYLIRIRTKDDCLPIFLKTYMNLPQLKVYFREKCKSIVGMANINAKEVQSISFYLPPIELQQKFATIVEGIEAQKEKIKSSIAETQTLFASLMAKYFDEEQNDRISK